MPPIPARAARRSQSPGRLPAAVRVGSMHLVAGRSTRLHMFWRAARPADAQTGRERKCTPQRVFHPPYRTIFPNKPGALKRLEFYDPFFGGTSRPHRHNSGMLCRFRNSLAKLAKFREIPNRRIVGAPGRYLQPLILPARQKPQKHQIYDIHNRPKRRGRSETAFKRGGGAPCPLAIMRAFHRTRLGKIQLAM